MISTEDLRKLRARDPLFLDALFRQTNPFLLRNLAAHGFRSETAEDLLQQTWERFFTNLDKFEGRSSLRTFLTGILLNKIREYRKADGRLVFEETMETALSSSFDPEGYWNAEIANADDLLYSSQLSRLIGECLERLPEPIKAAFILREVDQNETEEICNVLEVSASHLRVLIFRAKEKLRQCLEGKVKASR